MIKKIKIHGYRIYRDFTLEPSPGLNLIAGANESGKSTLLEAIALALTGRASGRTAAEELNPYWFNSAIVDDFVQALAQNRNVAWPEIHIELFLDDTDNLQQFCGAHNTDVPTHACPGIAMHVIPDPDYAEERRDWSATALLPLPVEYYRVEWRSFADHAISARPRQLATAIIDSNTVRSSTGVDYHMRYLLSNGLNPAERAAIAVEYRKIKAAMSDSALRTVNDRFTREHAALHREPIVLAMDQSARTSWEGAVVPHVSNVPFAMAGQGQQAAIKIALAMSRNAGRATFVMIEEPENHLTYSSLTMLLSRIASLAGEQQQLFISTHSSFVLNRMGLNCLLLLGDNGPCKLSGLEADTVAYFRKLPGYDTLRMALARKLVLVEGPSDEIVFERVFTDIYNQRPMDMGIDVVSVGGLSLARCLELCALLDKTVAAVRDNDGASPEELRVPLQRWLAGGKRELFIGQPSQGSTLEPQLVHSNGEPALRKILGLSDRADLETWMRREKTEAALRIADTPEPFAAPAYLREAAAFIHG